MYDTDSTNPRTDLAPTPHAAANLDISNATRSLTTIAVPDDGVTVVIETRTTQVEGATVIYMAVSVASAEFAEANLHHLMSAGARAQAGLPVLDGVYEPASGLVIKHLPGATNKDLTTVHTALTRLIPTIGDPVQRDHLTQLAARLAKRLGLPPRQHTAVPPAKDDPITELDAMCTALTDALHSSDVWTIPGRDIDGIPTDGIEVDTLDAALILEAVAHRFGRRGPITRFHNDNPTTIGDTGKTSALRTALINALVIEHRTRTD